LQQGLQSVKKVDRGVKMDKILASCFNLAKWENNGKFKSEKQAEFLLSKFDANSEYSACTLGPYNSQLIWTVKADKTGIVSITKLAYKSGKTTITFQRKSDSELAALVISERIKAEKIKAEKIEVITNLMASAQARIEKQKEEDLKLMDTVRSQPTVTDEMIASIQEGVNLSLQIQYKHDFEDLARWQAELDEINGIS
jgi:hypothetical protein